MNELLYFPAYKLSLQDPSRKINLDLCGDQTFDGYSECWKNYAVLVKLLQ